MNASWPAKSLTIALAKGVWGGGICVELQVSDWSWYMVFAISFAELAETGSSITNTVHSHEQDSLSLQTIWLSLLSGLMDATLAE